MHCLKEDIAKVGRCCFSQPVFFVVNFVGFKVIIFQILQIQGRFLSRNIREMAEKNDIQILWPPCINLQDLRLKENPAVQ